MTGTVRGPEKIIEASQQVEFFDVETGIEAIKRGIYTMPALDYSQGSVEDWLSQTEEVFYRIYERVQFPVMLGGEHTISFPPIKAAARIFGDISVLHFDAHSDMRDSYHNDKHSHASIMRRVHECVNHTYSVGIRAQCREERDYLNQNPHFGILYDHERATEGLNVQKALKALSTQKVYITIDLDYFSPEVMPSVGTPVPGGGGWYETLHFLRAIFEHKEVIGADVVELKPDHDRRSDFMAAQLVYKLITYSKFFEKFATSLP